MLTDFFLYSALGGSSSSLGGTFRSLSYPLTSPVTTAASQAAADLADRIETEEARVEAYEELQSAVTAFQDALGSFDFTDEDSATASAQAFVDGYNELMSTIDELTGSGGALEGDATASQMVNALQNQLSETFAGATGSFDALYQIGITPQADGTLALDTDTLSTAWAADAAGVDSLLTEAGSAYDTIADTYADSGGIIELTADVYGDNLIDLEMALPALQSMGEQTQAFANAQYAASVSKLYSYSLAETLFASYQSSASTSFFA